ncbi:MAG: TetR/AcrR family transcriptional regulator [Planctomycetes bacterium]|nr:TetR/AcrR family transcriptional regulator [Planctomycetota bacterium]
MVQRPDPEKRRLIIEIAARLFAARPYHEVKLDDVAAEAKIGKGTLYVYFKGKEQLYAALLEEGYVAMVDKLRGELSASTNSALEDLRLIVRAVLARARSVPHLFELMRSGQTLPCAGQITQHKEEMRRLIAQVLRRGIADGELADPDPDLTASYVQSLVRAAVLYDAPDRTDADVEDHILALLTHGIAAAKKRGRPTSRRTES